MLRRNMQLMRIRFLFFTTASLLLCYVASIHQNKAVAAVLNINTDQSSLLAFKNHIPYHEILAKNWSTSFPLCNWVGVTCGSYHHDRVTALNLSYMGLSGTISPHLGNLSFLAILDLHNNSFQGSLPNELTRLRRLKLMYLQFNNLSGKIPLWLASFPELKVLHLAYNIFTGNVSPLLLNITSLQKLDLGGNMISGFLPSNIFMAPALQYLNIEDNQISGPIPLAILNNSLLQTITFRQNHLSGELPQNIFHHLSNLKQLFLSWNHLSGELPLSLFNCKQLQRLSLSVNNFTGNIPPEIGNSTMLKEVYLGYNSFQGTVPNEIGNLQDLEVLNLLCANLSGYIPLEILNISTITDISLVGNQFWGSLPSSLGSTLPNLERLYLGFNYFTGKVPSSLSNATMLSELDLAINSFSGYIPDIFGNLRKLEWLNLMYNNLTIDPSSLELSIIDSLAGCKYLTRLDLSKNPLNSFLPISIGNLTVSLDGLGLGQCGLRGNIPANIGNLSGLTYLELSGNQLTGTIPTGMGKLKKLQQFSLYDNKLKGLVPHEICELKSLGILNLATNRFSGSIPSCLGNLTSLRQLFLASNTFTLIPPTLWSLADLLILNLSSNELRANLPSEIGNLKVVTELYLDNNQFSGNIPSSVGRLQDLINLTLANNEFEGPIPDSFGSLVSLELLDLSENNISGVIPKSLENLVYLRSFNVSFNKLEGQIPSGGRFPNFSAQSFMGNELLCGDPYLRFPKCKAAKLGKISKTNTIALKYILTTTIATLIILIIIYVSMRCKKQGKQPNLEVGSTVATWRRISQHELQQATEGFNDVNLLGIGSFGKVYKGILLDGLNIAVKVFNLEHEGAFKSFNTECEVLCNIRHRNLVKIISSCSNIDFNALVLSYMSNGSLEKWLHSHNHRLSLIQRLNIMIDVAEALDYLHHGCSTPIVHCDLKPSNVLLDDNMIAHVTDFGIAKFLGGEDSIIKTMTLATMGYMAPEFGLEGTVSKRGDVYSYGILLVETFTQKTPRDKMFQGEFNILQWVKESYPNFVMDIVDAQLLDEEGQFAMKNRCLTSIMGLALDCLVELPQERTNMKDVLVALKKIKVKFLYETRNPSV